MTIKTYFLAIAVSLLCFQVSAQTHSILSPEMHGIANWEHVDSMGNHRVVVNVDKRADAVMLDIPWRLRKIGTEKKNVVIIDATTGERIWNLFAYEINREHGKIAFQPQTVPGKYFIYYLTYKKEGSYYPVVTYYPYKESADPVWIEKNKLKKPGRDKKLPKAELIQFQAVNQLNSFYPMEIMATAGEVETLEKKFVDEEAIFFTEDRKFPIRSSYDIPFKWIEEGSVDFFNGQCDQGEYFTFQVGIYAFKKPINNIRVKYTKLVNRETGSVIPAGNFTCFNTEGIDVTGNYFEKSYSAPKSELHPLWIGLKIPENLLAGDYKGELFIEADGIKTKSITLNINVSENSVASMGDDELWRHSRLRWLNSGIAEDNEVVAPFTALKLNKESRSIECLGRLVSLDESGLPNQIISKFSERMTGLSEIGRDILTAPVSFNIDAENVSEWDVLNFDITKNTPGTIGWKSLSKSNSFVMELQASMDFDGNIDYEITLVATEDILVKDICLEVPVKKDVARYMMGLGERSGFLEEDVKWKWDVRKNQDGPWLGDVNAGLQCRFRDINYERPLNTNFYQQKPLFMPTSWYNMGKGGIDIEKGDDRVSIRSYSGERDIRKGEVFHFNFNIAITPFKTLDVQKQWSHRFYHRHKAIDTIAAIGANTINIHHATDINPYINYPFLTPEIMKDYVEEAHKKGMKVKFYYTLRELTNSCPELFALRSLGDEVFSEGNGGGYSWLQEHLDQTYIAAWFSPNKTDAAIINSGVSRWHNYYVEGLNWLVQNIGIDGIYIDDLAFDRTTMKRMRKVLERGNPNVFLDLHSANQFNDRDGFANSANLYLEHMPYIDRLWFGEYFDYDMRPDFWMIEVSGIPYGVMGEMLQDGGNPWRGMLYGMTGRMPWTGASIIKPIWEVWDEFEIEKSEMIGYWVSDNPVKTNSNDTYASSYVQKGEKTLISLATWATDDDRIELAIDWKQLGLDPDRVEIYAPAIEGFQDEKRWRPDETIVVREGKGYLLILQEK